MTILSCSALFFHKDAVQIYMLHRSPVAPAEPELQKTKVGQQNKQEGCTITAATDERLVQKVRELR